MFETIRKWVSKHNSFFVLVFPAAIMLLYLWCGCYYSFGEVIGRSGITVDGIREIFSELASWLRPTVLISLTILLGYWAWLSYRRENVPAVVIILLTSLAVILPFGEGWPSWMERLFGFAMFLWPVPVTCLVGFCLRRLVKNEKAVFVINAALVFLLVARLHLFGEEIMDRMGSDDLMVPVLWMAESLLWSAVFAFAGSGRDRRRNTVLAWLACLVISYFFTFVEVAYLSSRHIWDVVRGRYWNRGLFLCWPVFLTAMIGALCSRAAKDKPYSVRKASALYFSIVLPLCWLLTDISINFATGAFRDDICELTYLLLLAEFVIWKEVYGKQEHRRSRIGALLFMLLLNAGAALYLLVRNERLREVLYYLGFPFMDGSPSLRADWTGYRKETIRAFFTSDVTVLGSMYGNEGYYWVLNGSHGLASIRFHVGMLPLLIMVLLLVITVTMLWSRSRDGGEVSRCAGYFAFGCLLRMAMSVVLQMNMVLSPYIEFPFTGVGMPEIVVLALLLYERHRRMRVEVTSKETDT